MLKLNVIREAKLMLLAGVLASSYLVTPVGAQSPAPTTLPGSTAAKHYQPNRFAGRAGKYYQLVWGVDSLAVKWAESGEIIRFTYRVLDADKAKTLNDKKAEPFLIDPEAQVKLVVPSLEKVGKLRQSSTTQAGKSHWLAFSHKGRLVQRGERVYVDNGRIRAVGIV